MRAHYFAAVVVVGGLVLASCGNKKEADKAEEQAAEPQAPVAAKPADVATAPVPSAQNKGDLAPVGIDEVSGLLPVPTGARVVEAPKRAQVGERIEAAYCVEKGELEASAESLKTQLQEAGWEKMASAAHPTIADRISINGFRPDGYALIGTIQRTADQAECRGDKGMIYISYAVHRRQGSRGDAEPAPVAPPADPDTTPDP